MSMQQRKDLDEDDTQVNDVPFAEMMRRRRKSEVVSASNQNDSASKELAGDGDTGGNSAVPVDVDEEIRKLEEELANTSDDDSDSSTDDDDNSSSEAQHNGRGRVSFGAATLMNRNDSPCSPTSMAETNNTGSDPVENSVICLSTVGNDRIEPLPASALPSNAPRKLKGVDSGGAVTEKSKKKRKKRKSTDTDSDNEEQGTFTKRTKDNAEELRKVAAEKLNEYVPRSCEKMPFFCRICRVQSANEREFRNHFKTQEHKIAASVHQKATYCKLCRKQLTSVIQMKEHLGSRPHKERLDRMSSRGKGRMGEARGNHGRSTRENKGTNSSGQSSRPYARHQGSHKDKPFRRQVNTMYQNKSMHQNNQEGSGRQWCL
uniref:U1-type domain-containing protein n=2 Tax=Ditylum brightwellii TaxID=49249 RepID=A0A7S4RE94_9STRA